MAALATVLMGPRGAALRRRGKLAFLTAVLFVWHDINFALFVWLVVTFSITVRSATTRRIGPVTVSRCADAACCTGAYAGLAARQAPRASPFRANA